MLAYYVQRLNKAAEDTNLDANFYVIINEPIPWDSADYVFLILIGLLLVVNVAVTIFDTTPISNELDSSILRFFSMKRSLEIFLLRSKSKNVLSSFDGVRAISMTWVVLGSGLLLRASNGTQAINRERHLVCINMKGFYIRALV